MTNSTVDFLCDKLDEWRERKPPLISTAVCNTVKSDLRWVEKKHAQIPVMMGDEPENGIVTVGWAGWYKGKLAVMCVDVWDWEVGVEREYSVFTQEGVQETSEATVSDLAWRDIDERLRELFKPPSKEEE